MYEKLDHNITLPECSTCLRCCTMFKKKKNFMRGVSPNGAPEHPSAVASEHQVVRDAKTLLHQIAVVPCDQIKVTQ